jgi:hypothetical protein
MSVIILVEAILTIHHLAASVRIFNLELTARSKDEWPVYNIVGCCNDGLSESIDPLHLFWVQVANNSDALLPENIKDLIADIFFNYDDIRFNLSEFFLYDSNPVVFLVNKSLQGSPIRLHSADAIFDQ